VSTLHQFGLVLSLALGLAAASPAMVEAVCSGSTLPTLAANMAAGEWCQLATINNTGNQDVMGMNGVTGIVACTTSDYLSQFSNNTAWDPINQRLHYVGATHGNCYTGWHVVYSAATNAWTTDTWPGGCQFGSPTAPCFNHPYDFNTIDPTTGDHYIRHYGVDLTMQHGHSANGLNLSYTLTSAVPTSTQGFPVMKYFTELGGVVWADPDFGVYLWTKATNSWTRLANTSTGGPSPVTLWGSGSACANSTGSTGAYSPTKRVFIFSGGGGCTTVWKLDQNRTWTQMPNAPAGIGINVSSLVADPASGDFLLLSNGSTTMRRLNPDGTGTWSTVSQTLPAVMSAGLGPGDGLTAAADTTHGVVIYVKYTGSSTQMWLFKLSPSSPNQPAPAPPIGLNTR
jgi:hypothetical protein